MAGSSEEGAVSKEWAAKFIEDECGMIVGE